MSDDLRQQARERIDIAIDQLHRAERALAAGRPISARRLRKIHNDLAVLRDDLRRNDDD